MASRPGRGVGRLALCVVAAATVAVLMSPGGRVAGERRRRRDRSDRQAAGGPDSVVGDKDGDVYQVGDRVRPELRQRQDLLHPATGAHLIYGEILNRYQALGGPADSDLGFPTIDEAVAAWSARTAGSAPSVAVTSR